MRLDARPGETIDRGSPLTFRFDDREVHAFAGDTIGSALYAGGQRIFSRSFKYHRARGLLCCSGHCPNCMMTVDGVPNVRVCVEPVRAGARVEAQNVVGSLRRDLLAVTDRLGAFTPVGFYYRTMIRPRRAWPLYERFLRNVAGLGRVDVSGGHTGRYDVEHRRARVLVVGGGAAGVAAAREAAADGDGVVLVDERARDLELPGVEVIAPASVLGLYEGGLVPVVAGRMLYRFRADHVVVASGGLEQPLVFPGNDLVGVMLPEAARRLVDDFSIRPGARAVCMTGDGRVDEVASTLAAAGVDVAEVVDLTRRSVRELRAIGRKGALQSLVVDGRTIECDVAFLAGVRQPAYSLLAQAGARVEYDAARGVFVPAGLPLGLSVAGSVAGGAETGAVPEPIYGASGKHGKCVVCLCEDVTDKDLRRAVREGFDSIEIAKRYTTVTMGPCQGKLCHLGSIRLLARETGATEAEIGTTTARPPWTPVELGRLAGRHHDPVRRSSLHALHEAAGATMMWAGQWKRPHSYGDPQDEVRAVHERVGVIDVSTLGKLIVQGPDAAALLERLYPNRFADLAPGRIRYGVLTTDGGRIMDDGTIARLDDDTFYVTTTSGGAESVYEWFGWWNAVWGYDVEVVNVTGALAAINVAGPEARRVLAALTRDDVDNESLGYLDARRLRVAGIDSLALRIGFVGELGYELHLPSPAAAHVWDAVVAEGATPFGVEAQRVLRLEKQHVIVGQDTDSESNLLSAGMGWIAKLDKDDFVGKAATQYVKDTGVRERLVGFRAEGRTVPLEGAQVVVGGRPAGRVTSARYSDVVGGVIGLAWVGPEQAESGTAIAIRSEDATVAARVELTPFYDPQGERQRA